MFIAYQIVDFSGPEFVRYLLFPWWCLCAVFFEKKLHAKYGARITGSDLTADVLQVAAATKTPVVIRDIHVETIVTEGDRMKVHNQTATCDLLRAYSP